MKKTYYSNTCLCISVTTASGRRVHVRFEPETRGSVYATSDADLQAGLESHHKFGRGFVIRDEVPETVEKAEEAPAVPETVTVSSLDDAKEMLATRFGISRSKLRYRQNIMDAAKEHGIDLVIK